MSTFDPRVVIDTGGILPVNLAKGRIAEGSANLPGPLLVSAFGVPCLPRSELEPSARRPLFMYLDDFQSFATLSLTGMIGTLTATQA